MWYTNAGLNVRLVGKIWLVRPGLMLELGLGLTRLITSLVSITLHVLTQSGRCVYV